MKRLIFSFLTLFSILPGYAQDLSEKLVGRWSLLSSTYISGGSEEELTWNWQPSNNTLGIQFCHNYSYNWFIENGPYNATSDCSALGFSIIDSILVLNSEDLEWVYTIDKLTADTLVLLRMDAQQTKRAGSDTHKKAKLPGFNIVKSQLYFHRISPNEIARVEDKGLLSDTLVIVEEMPEFPGGVSGLMKFLGNSIRYPKRAQREGAMGLVLVNFIVSSTGNVINGEIIRSPRLDFSLEVVRILKNMPRWTPGKQNGKSVSVRYTLPVQFSL